jgi:hypothetical protein
VQNRDSTPSSSVASADLRFAGHQTFPLRITWLPKAAAAIQAGNDVLSDPLDGVVALGLGKNMVEALRCWVEAYGVAQRAEGGGWRLTEEGQAIFGAKGHDRYLEDAQTLWWLHWKISTLRKSPFAAWEIMVNRWNDVSFTPSAALAAFQRQVEAEGRQLSDVTLKQHFDVWLHSYCPPRGGRGAEEGLDSPLVALGLVRPAAEREVSGRREPVYVFDLGQKRGVSQALFRYCISDWWSRAATDEETVGFHQLVIGPGSPGRVLRMSEQEVRERMQLFHQDANSGFELHESLNQYQVRRRGRMPSKASLLDAIYLRAPMVAPPRRNAHV